MEHLNSQVLKGILFLKVIFNPISFSQLNPVFFPLGEEISCFKWIKQWKLRFRRFCCISSSSTAAQIWCRTWMSASHLLVLFSFFPVTGGKRNPRKEDIVGANFLSFFLFFYHCVSLPAALSPLSGRILWLPSKWASFFQARSPPSLQLLQIHFILLYHKIQNNNKAFHIYKMYKSLEIILHISVINSFFLFWVTQIQKYESLI